MRTGLAAINGKRSRFTATFKRFGSKTAYKGPRIRTALFVDVRNFRGEPVSDHVWICVGEQIERLDLAENDQVSFDARVTQYVKGYKGRRGWDEGFGGEVDYRLSWQTNFRKLPAAVPPCGIPARPEDTPLFAGSAGEAEELSSPPRRTQELSS